MDYACTVNFSDTVSIEAVRLLLEGISKWKHIKLFKYVFEQRGTTEEEMGKGMHTHFVICFSEKIDHLHRRLFKLFKNYVGNSKHVCVKECKNVEQWIRYMEGDKKDLTGEKAKKVSMDAIWREKMGLNKIY